MTEGPQRTRFRRRRDYLAAVLVVVVVAATWIFVWQTSDAHNTTSRTANVAATIPDTPDGPPPSLAQVWQQPSTATDTPLSVGANVVTGSGGSVVGRDPFTGQQRWLYRRDLPLCTLGQQWGRVLAFYRKNGWCGEITSLYPDTGQRGAQRNGDTELGTRMIGDGSYVTTTGRSTLDTFDASLVRKVIYGNQPDPKNSGRQPRTGCHYGSAAAASGQLGVVERCGALSSQPDGGADRFTVYSAVSKGKDMDEPDVGSSVRLPGSGARVVAMNDRFAAVALPNPARLLVIDKSDGAIKAQYSIPVPDAKLGWNVPGGVVPVSEGPNSVYWYTGSGVIALSSADFRPQWTLNGALGPGTQFVGRTLIPVPSGIEVLDADSGRKLGVYPLDRHGYRGEVSMSTLGPMVFEQRGGTLVALR
ncbi:hypothetical protein [Sciscionella marina]|uniref:Rv3212 family protein n=1 Tax=Sciscionella marina TaxID=508770 RepID=UPI00036E78DF|nr:hypothetical protein [Sciscionella marina]